MTKGKTGLLARHPAFALAKSGGFYWGKTAIGTFDDFDCVVFEREVSGKGEFLYWVVGLKWKNAFREPYVLATNDDRQHALALFEEYAGRLGLPKVDRTVLEEI